MSEASKKMSQRDLIGTVVVDYDENVDIKRLCQERLAKLQAEMVNYDLGGMILFNPLNVRYATGVRGNEIIAMHMKLGYEALVPREGKPVLFSITGLEPQVIDGTVDGRDMENFDFWQTGDFNLEATRRWSQMIRGVLIELGIQSERIGLDRGDPLTMHTLESEGVELVDAIAPLAMARRIKTDDEVALIRQACAVADVALWEVQQAIRPGITENELFAILTYTNLKHNGERMDCKLLAAGGNTNPWLKRSASSRMVRPGDLVAMDTDMAGPLGYFADISRTYLCGDGKPNEEQLEAYKLAYDFLYKSIPLFTVGTTFQELAENVPPLPDIYKANRYPVLAHGVGMSDEWPAVFFADTSDTGFGNYPGELQENMVMTMEASFGREGGREQVKLEEELLITADGPEIISHAPYDLRFFS